jgi:shikimate 5-dehydrogenase
MQQLPRCAKGARIARQDSSLRTSPLQYLGRGGAGKAVLFHLRAGEIKVSIVSLMKKG